MIRSYSRLRIAPAIVWGCPCISAAPVLSVTNTRLSAPIAIASRRTSSALKTHCDYGNLPAVLVLRSRLTSGHLIIGVHDWPSAHLCPAYHRVSLTPPFGPSGTCLIQTAISCIPLLVSYILLNPKRCYFNSAPEITIL